jgi:hypothetical protein
VRSGNLYNFGREFLGNWIRDTYHEGNFWTYLADVQCNMKYTRELLDQQHSTLVAVIQYLDQINHSDTHIRHKVDVVLNHNTFVNKKSEEELNEAENAEA